MLFQHAPDPPIGPATTYSTPSRRVIDTDAFIAYSESVSQLMVTLQMGPRRWVRIRLVRLNCRIERFGFFCPGCRCSTHALELGDAHRGAFTPRRALGAPLPAARLAPNTSQARWEPPPFAGTFFQVPEPTVHELHRGARGTGSQTNLEPKEVRRSSVGVGCPLTAQSRSDRPENRKEC
jgi:hypothetical protein